MDSTELNERTTIKLPVGIAWGFVIGIACGSFFLGMSWFEIRQIARKVERVDGLEKRVIRIETKLGISSYNRHTNSVMVFSTRGDL